MEHRPPYLRTALRVKHHPFGLSIMREHPRCHAQGASLPLTVPCHRAFEVGVAIPYRRFGSRSSLYEAAGPLSAEVLPSLGARRNNPDSPRFIGKPPTDLMRPSQAIRSLHSSPVTPGSLSVSPGAPTPRQGVSQCGSHLYTLKYIIYFIKKYKKLFHFIYYL